MGPYAVLLTLLKIFQCSRHRSFLQDHYFGYFSFHFEYRKISTVSFVAYGFVFILIVILQVRSLL